MLAWIDIDTVLLDMDGTLLDLHFDDHFWREHLPSRYAERHGMPIEHAKSRLQDHYNSISGTLEWYCLDYWCRTLDMDVVKLKEEVRHLIAFRPEAVEFLAALRACGKRAVLVTNAHTDSLALKIRETSLDDHLHHVCCAHDLRLAKEDPAFWGRLQEHEPFVPERTLLIDDNLDVLESARQAGIRHLMTIAQPDSRRPARMTDRFPVIHGFAEITPRS